MVGVEEEGGSKVAFKRGGRRRERKKEKEGEKEWEGGREGGRGGRERERERERENTHDCEYMYYVPSSRIISVKEVQCFGKRDVNILFVEEKHKSLYSTVVFNFYTTLQPHVYVRVCTYYAYVQNVHIVSV